MDQQELGLSPRVVPTGEASYRHEPAEHVEGTYFAMGYRGKRVCIDTGILAVLASFKGQPTEHVTRILIDQALDNFIKDYSALWWKNHRTGELLDVVRITASFVKVHESPHNYGTELNPSRSFSHMELVLSPHYKVPNDQSMGSAPIHVS